MSATTTNAGVSSTPLSPAYTVPQTAYVPPGQRVNWRLVLFVGIVVMLLGWPLYTFVHMFLTGGVVDHGTWAEVDLKSLGYFDMDQMNGKLADIPERYRKLDGKKVVMEGEMYMPQGNDKAIREFVFVYNVQKCCFGGPPKVQERVFASAPSGRGVPWQPGDVGSKYKVTGILRVDPQRGPKGLESVYLLDVQKVELL